MNALERRWLQLATVLVGGTGIGYAVVRYLIRSDDPWTVVNHPSQPHLQHLHVLTAPLLVFAVGLIWHAHALVHRREGRPWRRQSGLALWLVFWPMVASGYALQVGVDPQWRSVWMWTHVVTGGLWIVAFVVHRFARPRRVFSGR